MANISNIKTERQYYIDWLRIILIISVFFFHVGMVFNTWPWHIKNDVQYGGMLKQVMIFLHNWRMPLLFMLSGAGTFYAVGRMTPGQYISERARRLLVPLCVGVFTLVPVQVYIEKINQYDSLLSFYTNMFDGIYPEGNFSWHHLWFIVYLFVIALFISPFLNLLRSGRAMNFVSGFEKILCKPFGLNIVIIPLLLSQVVLRNFFEQETHSLVDDWATFTYYVIFFLAGFLLLPRKSISEAMQKYRFLYLSQTIVITAVMFRMPGMAGSERGAELIFDISAIILSWTCAVTAIGFARKHLNHNSQLRKNANEAIYPFYLLHQPVIVVVAYVFVSLNIALLWKVLLITACSFSLIVSFYWFVIRPFNLLRIIFGMKKTTVNEKVKCFIIDGERPLENAERA